jgi:hypothetical protein
MSLPRPKWYTAEALAKYWAKYCDPDIDVSMVRLYNQTGELKAEVLFQDNEGQNKCWMPEDYTEADWQQLCLEEMIHVGKYYKLAEVERFEEKHELCISVPPTDSHFSAKHSADEEQAIPNADKDKPHQTPQGKILTGWKEIAEYLKVSISTAKRYSKGSRWLHHGPTGKPTTTSVKLDAWRLSPPQKKKQKKKMW